MPVLSIIFDLDGTLVDSLRGIGYCANSVLSECGFPQHPLDSYRTFVGDGLRMLFKRATPKGTTDDMIELCCLRFRQFYEKNWDMGCSVYPGIYRMLAELGERKIKHCVLSNKPDDFTQQFVHHFFPDTPFNPIFGQRNGVPPKPHPAGVLAVAKKLDCDPADMLFVGDSDVDILTAKNSGTRAGGVAWGFRPVAELVACGADCIFHHPMDIVKYVANTD